MNVNKTIETKARMSWSAKDISDHLWNGGGYNSVAVGVVEIYNSSAWKRGRASRVSVVIARGDPGEMAALSLEVRQMPIVRNAGEMAAIGLAISQMTQALGGLSPQKRRLVLKLVA